jgi:hypothetical protein
VPLLVLHSFILASNMVENVGFLSLLLSTLLIVNLLY